MLIDCDNVSPAAIESVLDTFAKYGMANVRHAHRSWGSPHLAGSAEKVHPYAILPKQQFAFTRGKNATDSTMIIDAMDLLYIKNVDTFVIMASDRDITQLVLFLFESGLPVYKFGEKKTPNLFVDAFSQFIYTKNLMGDDQEKAGADEPRCVSRRHPNQAIQRTTWPKQAHCRDKPAISYLKAFNSNSERIKNSQGRLRIKSYLDEGKFNEIY
nr:NYN domain-containing protein [Pseudomonas syringae]